MGKAELVSVIVPAYQAQSCLPRAVASVLSSAYSHTEVIVIADDGADYAAVLAKAGVADKRVRHVSTGHIGSGASAVRNAGLAAARGRLCAILDADDRFKPDKLTVMAPLARTHGLATCALDIVASDGPHLRFVGAGPDRVLTPGDYKFTNFSMDSMLVYDRDRADPRYDPGLPAMTDLDFLIRIFAAVPECRHVGTPLHDYVKMPVSISNGPGVTDKMIRAKTTIQSRLREDTYGTLPEGAAEGLSAFLEISIVAEQSYAPRAGLARPDLFEDHIEPILQAD